MTSVVIVGSDRVTSDWAAALRGAGHSVERYAGTLAFQDRFSGDPAEVLVVEIVNADHGEAMLMVQARAVWPGCRVIAAPRDRSYRASAFFGMGLWHPDRVLIQPVAGAQLVETVRQLDTGAGTDRTAGTTRIPGGLLPPIAGNVILRCGDPRPARWSVRTH